MCSHFTCRSAGLCLCLPPTAPVAPTAVRFVSFSPYCSWEISPSLHVDEVPVAFSSQHDVPSCPIFTDIYDIGTLHSFAVISSTAVTSLVCVSFSARVCGGVGLNRTKSIRGDFDLQNQRLRRVESDLCGINSEARLDRLLGGRERASVARSPSTVCSGLNSHSKSFKVFKSPGTDRR